MSTEAQHKMLLGFGGHVAFFTNGQQVPALQRSYIVLLLEHIQRHGIDPRKVEIKNGAGQRIYPFVTEYGQWNWSNRWDNHLQEAASRPLPELK